MEPTKETGRKPQRTGGNPSVRPASVRRSSVESSEKTAANRPASAEAHNKPVVRSNRVERPVTKRVPRRSTAVSKLNIGTIIFGLFCVYIFINIIIYFNRSHLSIYEVQQLALASNTKAEAVIVRNEIPVKTGIAGYVNYYMRSGTRVAKGETIYSIDESRQIYNLISGNDFNYTLSEEDISQIKDCIGSFNRDYSHNDFSMVYTLRDDLTTMENSISDMYLLENLNQILIDKDYSGALTVHKSDAPGLISYFYDTLDGLTADQVTLDTFDHSGYKSMNLFDSNLKEQGSVIYKLLADENWDLVLNLTEEQYNKLSSQNTLTYTIEEDNLRLTSPVMFMHVGEGYFARITLNQYMVRYLNKRFLTIALDMDHQTGLKIPKSSLVEKEFYMVPKEYFTRGGDNKQYGVCILRHDEETKKKYYDFLPTEIYYEDEQYNYIDMKSITYGTFIYDEKSQETFQISLVGKLIGVYCVNKGFAQFRRVDMMQEGTEFCVVKNGMSYSISEHDHIAEDSSTIKESQTIY